VAARACPSKMQSPEMRIPDHNQKHKKQKEKAKKRVTPIFFIASKNQNK
jgi:hypothetical protein